MSKYNTMTNDNFDRILQNLIVENSIFLLSIPGVYEVLSEHFNNEVLDRWEAEQGKGGEA